MVLVGYFHVPGTMVPHVRFLSGLNEEDIMRALESALQEWPSCERVEIYDECNKVILKQDRAIGRPLTVS